MDSPLNQDWLDEVARRRLPADEAEQWRRQLSERPSEARRLEEELALNHLLDAQLKPRVSSNFTARVLSDIHGSPEQETRISRWWTQGVARVWTGVRFFSLPVGRLWAHSIPIAIALVCVAIPLNWGWQRVQVHRHGTMARTAAELSVAAAMPGVAVLQDFDAVQLLETRSAPDDVTLMQALREDVP
jgi:anti-sigma factor RsiW